MTPDSPEADQPVRDQNAQGVRIDQRKGDDADLALIIHGRLSIQTIGGAWDATLGPIRKSRPKRLVIDAGDLEYCDGAGLGLIAAVKKELTEWNGSLQFNNLRPELQRLIDMSALADPAAPQLRPPAREGFIAGVGRGTATTAHEVYALIEFLGELTVGLIWSILHPRRMRWADLVATADRVGTDAVPVICLLGFLIGAILAFQSAPALNNFGARDMIPTLVSIALIRELGPLIACILMSGRTASAFAAELGTMTVTEEVNALRAMGFDPTRFLAVPRVLAAIAVAPILSVISSLMGELGGYSVMLNYGMGFDRYIHQVQNAVTYKDLITGEVKTLVFGLIIGGVGCLRGLRTGSGPGAVGDSTTRAVVMSIVLIIATDGLFGVLFYYLHL